MKELFPRMLQKKMKLMNSLKDLRKADEVMQTLYENIVVEWKLSDSEDRYIERVLWISPSNDVIYSIAMDDDKAFPIMKPYYEYKDGFESNLCKQVEWINENIPLIDSEDDSEHLTIRDKSWDAIKDIVLDEPRCFEKGFRGSRVREALERIEIHKSTIYRYLRRYWQGGKLKNALLPHFNNCGSYGNDRIPKDTKRGRPRKFEDDIISVSPIGIEFIRYRE
ncbi:hypothetical protein [Paenibacillus agricola]|uniref:Uncharacterized protein n=1 Tax=Paenibacillus agricola TaxID=2716264 RepID=A0ABX0JME3_9BACL|nr:hypothetical protein [Paenibacillus agricola]NHN35325.1 hypothetical protein [Paenibacillus agricola]